MIVVDASAILDVLLRTPAARSVESRLYQTGQTLHAPHLLDIEVAQVIRRQTVNGNISSNRGQEALIDLSQIPIRKYAHNFLLPRVWELRNNLTAYDAAYVALAEALDAALLTCDRLLATAAGHHARVELV